MKRLQTVLCITEIASIGLAMVVRVIHWHGGCVRAEPVIDKGMINYVTF